ncbi:hypothetical protein Chor_012211 [Crotalus horridus]
MICPFCLVSPPDDYNPTVSEEHSIAIKKNTQFRKLCNNFFIDLVSTMCFKGNNPPEKSVIEELLNLMFVHKSVLKGPENLHTKSLSPFDDVVDKTPVIRSVVLKLLLKYSFSDVKVYVQEHLSQVEANHIMDKEDKIELYMLFISCFEVKLKDMIKMLLLCYCIRICYIVVNFDNSEDKEKQIYLEKVRQFFHCIQNNWHNIYLVRKLNSQYGLEFTQKLFSNHHYHWVFPSEIIEEQQTLQPGCIDRFLVCGKDYKAIRNAVGEALIKLETKVIAAALKQCDILKEFIRNSRVLPSAELKAFAESLVSNQLPLLTLPPLSFGHNTMVIEMAVHTAVVLFCGQNRILQPLRNLAFSPNTMLNAFLPTMPEDMLAQAVQWKSMGRVHWYTCPNGHPCVIGECGQPIQYSRCVDCGVQIGGVNYRPVPNFQRASNIQDRTQTGHVLGDPRKRDPVITPERELSPAALILIRLLTHLALLLGASNDAQVFVVHRNCNLPTFF